MENFSLSFSHIGWAVPSIEKAFPQFQCLGFRKSTEIQLDEQRDIYVILLRNDENIVIELIQPATEYSIISNILKDRGATPYHICLSINKKDYTYYKKILKEKGFLEIKKSEYSSVFNDDVSFYFSKNIGIIEILTKD